MADDDQLVDPMRTEVVHDLGYSTLAIVAAVGVALLLGAWYLGGLVGGWVWNQIR